MVVRPETGYVTRATLHAPRALAVAGGASLVAVLLIIFPGVASWTAGVLTLDPSHLRDVLLSVGPAAPVVALAANVAQAVLAPLPGAAVVYLNGAVFGVWAGALLNLVGGMLGALACFAIARRLLRPSVTRWFAGHRGHPRLQRLVDGAQAGRSARRDGLAILALRLVPGAPFDLVSYGAGVTKVGWWPFLWGTTAGSAPHAFAYALLGASLHVPLWAGIVAAFALGAAVAGARKIGPLVRRLMAIVRAAGAPATPTYT